MTETEHNDETDSFDTNMGRRRAMQLFGATAATVAAGGALTGVAGAESVDFTSSIAHDPYVDGTVTVAEHRGDMAEMQYVDDQGDVAWLIDHGLVLASGEDDTPHNPIALRADRIAASEYRKFPRGEQYDSDSDGEDDADLNVVDATHWSVDESGSAGSSTLETVTAANDEDALHVATSSQGAGDAIVFTFSDFTIDSGELRKFLQAVVNVNALDSSAVVEVSAVDSTDAKATAVIDSSADADADSTIATATGDGIVYQQQIGGLVDSLDTIESLEIAISEGNADLTFAGLNLEREDSWKFGTYEFTNSDDEVETDTYVEPSGTFSVTSLDSLGDAIAGSRIHNVEYDAELRARELPSSSTLIRETEVDETQYDRPIRLEVAHVMEWPTAYDLTSSLDALRDVVRMSSSRYLSVGVETAAGTVETWDDVDALDMASKTSQYDSVDAERDLSSAVSAGSAVVVYYDLSLNSDEADAYLSAGGGGAAGGGGGDDGGNGLLTLLGGGVIGFILYIVNKARKAANAAT